MYNGNIYKIIFNYFTDTYKVFYHVDFRKGFCYETDTVDGDMQNFMVNANYNPCDFQATWEE